MSPRYVSCKERLANSLLCVFRTDFIEIMEMLDKRLNDKGKNWRHVFKVSAVLISCCAFTSLTIA